MNEATNLQIPTQPPLVIPDVSRCPLSVVYLEDCVQGLKRFADNHFDLAIVDTPYGIGMGGGKIGNSKKIISNLLGVIVAYLMPIILQN